MAVFTRVRWVHLPAAHGDHHDSLRPRLRYDRRYKRSELFRSTAVDVVVPKPDSEPFNGAGANICLSRGVSRCP